MNKVVIGILILVLLAGVAYFFTVNNRVPTTSLITPPVVTNANNSPSITTSPTIEISSSNTVKEFYTNYEDCLKNPPAQAKGQVSIYCQSHNPLITTTFVANLERGGVAKAGADPIVCAQALPESFTLGNPSNNDNESKVIVTEKLGAQKVEVTVSLLKENNIWKVDNITCPQPQ